ncbi:hypothetical protein J7337_007847 [Fusarium musae]|uniref:Major facilitator superfamily (MFS) profile domain-containing protein n=1 Tax=Fusarium musae TaxID=1042133 RepID=A0A9P8DCM0_9HYPO|nr:hypothetical protein J7337_007847 [Fusarium musae]KAG9499391.1 hypothetical protein J7337_007847 [Fusarium musae]
MNDPNDKREMPEVEEFEGLVLADVIPKRDKWWFQYPNLRKLNLLLFSAFLAQFTCGFYGSANLGTLVNAINIGVLVSALFSSQLCEIFGRKKPITLGTFLIIIGSALQGGAQNLGMFIAGRIIIGLGTGIVAVAAPQLMTEVAYPTHRGKMLVYKDRRGEALAVLSQYHSCGDHDSRLVRFELLEIEATLEEEKKHKAIQWSEFIRTSGNRKRLWILISMGFAAQLSGLGLTGYYLTKILNSIGVTNANTQLLINVIAAVWQLCCSVFFAMLIDRVGRRGLITFRITTMLVVFIVWTICSALNEERHFSDRPMALAVVATIFLFQVGYRPFAISTVPYVVECSLYSLRSKTAMIFQFCGYSASFFTGYVNPVALDRVRWRYYIFACAVLGVECVFAWWYLPETKGKGLEEIGQIFDGEELLTGTQAITKKRAEKYRAFDEGSIRERKALSTSHIKEGEE